jgi:hypothetical protein
MELQIFIICIRFQVADRLCFLLILLIFFTIYNWYDMRRDLLLGKPFLWIIKEFSSILSLNDIFLLLFSISYYIIVKYKRYEKLTLVIR